MNSKSELSWKEVISLVDEILSEAKEEPLNNVQEKALEGSYEGKQYNQMVEKGYQPGTLQDAGQVLWEKLSRGLRAKGLGKKVTKTSFMQDLKRYKRYKEKLASLPEATPMPMEEAQNSESSGEQVPLDSHFYIERCNVESLCCETITQPGALLRIKSQQKMGKTSVLAKLLNYARQQGYQTVRLDLNRADSNTLTNLKTFLQWLCVEVADSLDEVYDSLELQSKVEEWQDNSDPKTNCRKYFQNCLLSNITTPLVLAIDSFELLFKYPDIFLEFVPLLRTWHENAKPGDRFGNIWRKLRVVLVYSTETYPELDTNHSPFNVGVPIKLPDFNLSEVTTLTKRHELYEQLGENGLHKLMGMVGGHPYLIQQALISLKRQQTTLEQLLSLAPTEQGIYSHHLRQQLWILQHNPQLKSAYQEVIMANEPVRLDTEVAFKLHSIGLVKFCGNDCIPSYELYRQYFSVHLE